MALWTDITIRPVCFILPVATGYMVLLLMFRKRVFDMFTRLCIAYGLGLGILVQLMLILGTLNIPLSITTINAPLSIVLISLIVFKLRNEYDRGGPGPGKTLFLDLKRYISRLDYKSMIIYIPFALYLGWIVFYVFWEALSIPVYSYDAVYAIAVKAKVFFYERSIEPLRHMAHPSYPVFIPLVESWIAIIMDRWNDQVIKIIFPVTFISFLAIHAYTVNMFTNRKWALFSTILLCSSNFFIVHAALSYRDLFLLYYLCSSVMFLIMWARSGNEAFLVLAGLFTGFGTSVKLEGTLYLLILSVMSAMLIFSGRFPAKNNAAIRFLKFSVPGYLICGYFYAYKVLKHIPPEKVFFDFSPENIKRIPLILKAFLGDMFLTGNWNIVWFILAVSLLINHRRLRSSEEARILSFTLVLIFGCYFLNGFLTSNFEWLGGPGTSTALSRIILQFFPLATLLTAFLNYNGGNDD